jgi:hypothetical protein
MRILVAYSQQSTYVQTTLDYLTALKKHLQAEVDFVHVTHGAIMDFDMAKYDAVFHNYCARLCYPGYVSSDYLTHLRRFRGLKVLSVQDEYDATDALKAAIKDLRFDVVLTCTPEETREYVYPAAEFSGVRFERVLTGYVSDELVSKHAAGVPLRERPIVLGYRGRDIGGRYGRLAYEKYIIGLRMKEICAARSIPCDIAVDEHSRIYGAAWFDFIGACRAMLGSESGSNVFDFSGSIARTYNEMAAARGGAVSYQDFEPITRAHEQKIEMGQISPRIFECAMMRTPMVLFRGHYSGAVAPDVHYIPLEKNFSNVDRVLNRLNDIPSLEAMVQRTYDHLVGSGSFSYRAFGARIDQLIREEIKHRRSPSVHFAPIPQAHPKDLQLRGQRPTPAPGSFEMFLNQEYRVEVGIYSDEVKRINAEIARFLDVLSHEVTRLKAVYHSSHKGDDRQANAPLFDVRFAAACKRGADADAVFREAEKALWAALENTTATGHWKRLSELYQERIKALNAYIEEINAEYEELVKRANLLILINNLEAQIIALFPRGGQYMGSPAQWDLAMPTPPDRMEDTIANLRRQAYALDVRSLTWVGLSEEVKAKHLSAIALGQRSCDSAALKRKLKCLRQAFLDLLPTVHDKLRSLACRLKKFTERRL